jgi:hypothetical protein
MKIFAQDVGFPGAPVFLPDGRLLCVEMVPDYGCVTHLSADDKSRRLLPKTGRPNGLARDKDWKADRHEKFSAKPTADHPQSHE